MLFEVDWGGMHQCCAVALVATRAMIQKTRVLVYYTTAAVGCIIMIIRCIIIGIKTIVMLSVGGGFEVRGWTI
jgi:hypothetical protein